MRRSRRGLTLVEVLVATAILSAATLTISVLWRRGIDVLESTDEKTRGVLIGQSILARLEAGAIEAETRSDVPLVPGWTIDLEVENGPVTGTKAVSIYVRRAGPQARLSLPVRVSKLLPSGD